MPPSPPLPCGETPPQKVNKPAHPEVPTGILTQPLCGDPPPPYVCPPAPRPALVLHLPHDPCASAPPSAPCPSAPGSWVVPRRSNVRLAVERSPVRPPHPPRERMLAEQGTSPPAPPLLRYGTLDVRWGNNCSGPICKRCLRPNISFNCKDVVRCVRGGGAAGGALRVAQVPPPPAPRGRHQPGVHERTHARIVLLHRSPLLPLKTCKDVSRDHVPLLVRAPHYQCSRKVECQLPSPQFRPTPPKKNPLILCPPQAIQNKGLGWVFRTSL